TVTLRIANATFNLERGRQPNIFPPLFFSAPSLNRNEQAFLRIHCERRKWQKVLAITLGLRFPLHLLKNLACIYKIRHLILPGSKISPSAAPHVRAISGFKRCSRLPISITCCSLRSKSRRLVADSSTALVPRERSENTNASTVACGTPPFLRPISSHARSSEVAGSITRAVI